MYRVLARTTVNIYGEKVTTELREENGQFKVFDVYPPQYEGGHEAVMPHGCRTDYDVKDAIDTFEYITGQRSSDGLKRILLTFVSSEPTVYAMAH